MPTGRAGNLLVGVEQQAPGHTNQVKEILVAHDEYALAEHEQRHLVEVLDLVGYVVDGEMDLVLLGRALVPLQPLLDQIAGSDRIGLLALRVRRIRARVLLQYAVQVVHLLHVLHKSKKFIKFYERIIDYNILTRILEYLWFRFGNLRVSYTN